MKKVFKSEEEILSFIDRYLEDIRQINDQIMQKEYLATRLRDTCEAHRIPGLRTECEHSQREIAWREGRLETLKEILAEWRTLPLPFNKLNELDPVGTPPDVSVEVVE